MGYFAPLLNRFIPTSLQAFHREFPAVDVKLVELPLGKQIAAVKSGAVQVGFMLVTPSDPPCPLPHLKIVSTPLCAAFSRNHPLAALSTVRLADVAPHRLVSLWAEPGSPRHHRSVLRRVFASRRLKIGQIKEIEGAEALHATVESGLGVSLVAGIGSLSQSAQLVLKPLADTGDDLTLDLLGLWRKTPAPAFVISFLECMRRAALASTY